MIMPLARTGLRLLTVMAVVLVFNAATAALAAKKSAVVLDATTGRILYSQDGNARRYPASLTKMMTLYLLFEDIERGRVRPTTMFHVSAHAAAQEPMKLWLKPGQSISADDAVRAIVTLSANDVAVVIAENLEDSEADFAKRMTDTAHRLGMTNTQFRNASGLPAKGQYTTAEDMAILGAALQARFAEDYHYFSVRHFAFRGHRYHGHNHLLRRMRGIDGIKTGYTRASGFNIVTSRRRHGRKVIVAVMGGTTYKERDARVVRLLKRYFAKSGKGQQYFAGLMRRIEDASPRVAAKTEPIELAAKTMADAYAIQVGALPTQEAAQSVIEKAEPYVFKILSGAKPMTQRVSLDDKIYFRATFDGFEDAQSAQEACSKLKARQFACYAVLRSASAAAN
jgi:D-alanyl-D-alanine carboxypeptidase